MSLEIDMRYGRTVLGLCASVVAGCAQGAANDDAGQSTGGITVTASGAETGDGTGTATEPDTLSTTGTEGGTSTQSSTSTDTGTSGADGTTGDVTTSQDDADSTTTTNGASATAGSDGPMPCDVAEATLEPVPPNIMLVLDKSGSMIVNQWDHDQNGGTPNVTRWHSLYEVVGFVVTTFDGQINFGTNLFPAANATATYDVNGCITANGPEIPVAPNNQAAILAGIPGANETSLFGGTPATAGVSVARQHLLGLNPANPRAIIFITDGAANCSGDASSEFERFEEYDDELPVVVGDAWTNDQISTYVVGIDIVNAVSPEANDGNPDNTNTYLALNEVAVAGGHPNPGAEQFYQTTNQAELQDALQLIIDDALSCTVPLTPAPVFPELLEVYIEAMMVPEVTDCATEDGWVYTQPNGPYDAIELCGSWCDALKSSGTVTAEYYCTPG